MASSSSLSATGAKKDNEGSSLTPPKAKKDDEASPKGEAQESIGESKCENDTIASATSTNRTLILRSSDDKNFEIDELVALASQTLEDLLLTCGNELPNVSSEILELVIVFLKKHHNEECKTKEEMKEIYEMLCGMIHASNYLNIKSLLDSACEEFAGRVKDMAVEELRALIV
ncbi:hypothetical protein MKW94_000136 [Papaver nudicaule]|uniref:SKP1 component POZ domain-containing protein n=1 Tax=Papaver nudicaule TaxID=74823 RepID=A0AA41VPJ7_PAPNU|nr:hypothetical protein [Papaver nudicaule]